MLDRKTAPGHAEINSFDLPSHEVIVLGNGIPMYTLRGVTQRVLKIELIFKAGKWFESKTGVSYFTAHMLEKGTVNKSSFEIADYFERHGASVEITPGFDFVSVALYTLTKNITNVLPLFLELITSCVFPEEELKLQKEIFIQNLKVNNEKTSYVASKLFRQQLFGNSHPYGNAIEESDVHQLSRKDLSNFFSDHFSLTQVFVAGCLDEQLLNYLTSEFATLSIASLKEVTPAITIAQSESSRYIEKTGSIQSSIRLGKRTISRNHQDYPALVLINHILGGYFSSRLMKNIREDKGLTYGIHSSINNLKNDAFFVIAADVNRVNKDQAILEIKRELNQLCNEIVNSQELQTARNHLLGGLQLEITNPFSVIEKRKIISLYALDENFYNKLFIGILNLDRKTLLRVANDYLSYDIIEVAVG